MKENKFRVWEPLNKKMHYLDFALYEFGDGRNSHKFVLPPARQGFISPYTFMNLESVDVMQYTGVNDSKGKEIYEGDLLRISDREDDVQKVYFEEGSYGTHEFALFELLRNKERTFEVVGNVYEK